MEKWVKEFEKEKNVWAEEVNWAHKSIFEPCAILDVLNLIVANIRSREHSLSTMSTIDAFAIPGNKRDSHC